MVKKQGYFADLPLIRTFDFVHSLTVLPPIQKSTTSARTTWPKGAVISHSQAAFELYFAGQFIELKYVRKNFNKKKIIILNKIKEIFNFSFKFF